MINVFLHNRSSKYIFFFFIISCNSQDNTEYKDYKKEYAGTRENHKHKKRLKRKTFNLKKKEKLTPETRTIGEIKKKLLRKKIEHSRTKKKLNKNFHIKLPLIKKNPTKISTDEVKFSSNSSKKNKKTRPDISEEKYIKKINYKEKRAIVSNKKKIKKQNYTNKQIYKLLKLYIKKIKIILKKKDKEHMQREKEKLKRELKELKLIIPLNMIPIIGLFLVILGIVFAAVAISLVAEAILGIVGLGLVISHNILGTSFLAKKMVEIKKKFKKIKINKYVTIDEDIELLEEWNLSPKD